MSNAPPRHKREDSIDLQTRIDCLQHLMATSAPAAWTTVFGVLLVSVWLYQRAAPVYLLTWFAASSTLVAVQLIFRRRFIRDFLPEHLAGWENAYALLMGLKGLTWGLLAWIPTETEQYQVLFCITLAVLLSSHTLVASRRSLLSFSICAILPLTLAQMRQDSTFAFFLGFGLLAMGAVILAAYRINFRMLSTAIANQHRSAALMQQQRSIFESAGEGIVFIKPKPAYTTECNRRFAEMLGYPLEVMIGMEPWHWHPDREQWRTLVATSSPVIAQGLPYRQVIHLRRADGSLFWADVTGMAIDGGDLKSGTVWVISDITAKRATEAALRHSEQRFRDLVKISSDIYWQQDRDFRFTHFDGKDQIQAELLLAHCRGHRRWELPILADSTPLDWEEHKSLLARHEPFRDLIYPIRGEDGQKRWLCVSGNPLFDDNGHFIGYHGVTSDITNRVQSEQRFRHLAFHDVLTQLPNRRLFEDRLEQAILAATRNRHNVALLLVDLDGFKQINDQHGHLAGDHVLRTVAERILASVRESDTVARLGGDEFVVLLGEITGLNTALLVAEKIHSCLSAALPDELSALRIGVSIGIAIYPEHGGSPAELLAHADAAMYSGKHVGGRTTRVFEAS